MFKKTFLSLDMNIISAWRSRYQFYWKVEAFTQIRLLTAHIYNHLQTSTHYLNGQINAPRGNNGQTAPSGPAKANAGMIKTGINNYLSANNPSNRSSL